MAEKDKLEEQMFKEWCFENNLPYEVTYHSRLAWLHRTEIFKKREKELLAEIEKLKKKLNKTQA